MGEEEIVNLYFIREKVIELVLISKDCGFGCILENLLLEDELGLRVYCLYNLCFIFIWVFVWILWVSLFVEFDECVESEIKDWVRIWVGNRFLWKVFCYLKFCKGFFDFIM